MISNKANIYCSESLSCIANYNQAVESPEMYDVHHLSGEIYSKDELLAMNAYFHVPSEDLVFVTKKQHMKIHNGNSTSQETRQKISEGLAKHYRKRARTIRIAHKDGTVEYSPSIAACAAWLGCSRQLVSQVLSKNPVFKSFKTAKGCKLSWCKFEDALEEMKQKGL